MLSVFSQFGVCRFFWFAIWRATRIPVRATRVADEFWKTRSGQFQSGDMGDVCRRPSRCPDILQDFPMTHCSPIIEPHSGLSKLRFIPGQWPFAAFITSSSSTPKAPGRHSIATTTKSVMISGVGSNESQSSRLWPMAQIQSRWERVENRGCGI
jgi:hypothetical protein